MMSPLAHQAHKPLADGGSSWRISKANYLKRPPAVAPRGLFASVRLAYLGHIMLSHPRILPARFIAPCLPTKPSAAFGRVVAARNQMLRS